MQKTLLSAAIFLAVVAGASALTIEHMEPRKMEEGDYLRVPEFFGKERKNPTRVEVHAQENPANGMAWVVELDENLDKIVSSGEATSVKLEVLFKHERHPRTFDFDLTTAKLLDTKTLYLGVGAQTAGADHDDAYFPKFLAWKLAFLNEAGEVVTEAPSTLWAY